MPTELPASTSRIQRWRSFRFREWLRGLISPSDSNHELALGASVGTFVAFTPLFGLHMVIIVFVALLGQRLIRFNKAIAIATCYVNNPFTFAPMLWASYKVGARLVPSAAGAFEPEKILAGLDSRHGFQAIPGLLHGVGLPMLVGCLVLGVVTAVLMYPIARAFANWYRRGETVPNLGSLAESTPVSHPSTPEATRP